MLAWKIYIQKSENKIKWLEKNEAQLSAALGAQVRSCSVVPAKHLPPAATEESGQSAWAVLDWGHRRKKNRRENEHHWEKITPENCVTTSRSRLEEMVMLFVWTLSSFRPTTPPINQKLILSQVPGIDPWNTEQIHSKKTCCLCHNIPTEATPIPPKKTCKYKRMRDCWRCITAYPGESCLPCNLTKNFIPGEQHGAVS